MCRWWNVHHSIKKNFKVLTFNQMLGRRLDRELFRWHPHRYRISYIKKWVNKMNNWDVNRRRVIHLNSQMHLIKLIITETWELYARQIFLYFFLHVEWMFQWKSFSHLSFLQQVPRRHQPCNMRFKKQVFLDASD